MKEVRIKISEKQYNEYKDNVADLVDALVPDDIIYGYGLYSSDLIAINGEYFLRYTRGDSCD